MAKYMLIGSYTATGAAGLIKEGGSRRVEAATAAVESAGGTLESFYFGFGADDYYVTVDFPDHASAAASLTVGASGSSEARLVVLLTPEELDAASQKSVTFRPPGA